MPLETPIVRIGLAGFSVEQQLLLGEILAQERASGLHWDLSGGLTDADACWVNGARMQRLADGTLRIGSGVPAGRSVQIDPNALERPVAYSLPLAPRDFHPELCFELTPDDIRAVLRKMAGSLRALAAQFCLASQILEHEAALGAGVYHVISAEGKLLAVVDLRGDVGVLPSAPPSEFEGALWNPQTRKPDAIPEHFQRCSLSRLMWQYALRTARDLLPRRYRMETLYFRRPPRLQQRHLQDAHLLVLRELSCAPGTFGDLQRRTRLPDAELARDLAALYLVGAVTSNPKRAANLHRRAEGVDTGGDSGQNTGVPSGLDHDVPSVLRRPGPMDKTAPAPLVLD